MKIIITWPNLEEQSWDGDAFAVDHYYRVTQGSKEVEKLYGK